MPSFKYRARDPEGKAITGLLEGEDKASVAEHIRTCYPIVESKSRIRNQPGVAKS